MPNNPSLDPQRTVDHSPTPEASSTVDGTTVPHAPAPPADAPTIPGYTITAEIAKGGMGRVYAGRERTLDREVAIKTLLPGANPERFVVEAKITARLPHPGIPPVHALGTLADGSPYLAMKLIHGRTLADLLTERPTPLYELPRFVQMFEQIAQAVGFAHSRGIIHRDLKPLNVMVGAFGEVQVMDWGLAKDMQKDEVGRMKDEGSKDPADSSFIHHPSSLDVTQAGTILGTPGYMAPEQARGEAVDARADVFALGAMLAAILTGKPAFVWPSQRETIDQAARANLGDVRERLTNSGADGELIALALRCLSANAEERPSDGREVASEVSGYRAGVEARLKRAETERAEALVRETEQRKRRRVLFGAGLVVGVALLTGLGVSLWQMNVARQERDAKGLALDAETKARQDEAAARRRAFAALRSMTDVFDKRFAQAVVLTDDDKAFIRGIIQQFDAFAAIQGDDADSRAIRAEGRARVGRMRNRLSEMKEAEQDFNAALDIHKQLAADFPARPEFRQELARTHLGRGNLLRATARPAEAEKDYDAAVGIQKQLAADFPTRPEFRQDLARSHLNRGNLMKDMGRLKEMEQDYDAAVGIQKQLAADFPNQPEFRQDLGMSHTNRGNLRSTTGRPKEAEQDYDAALSIQKQLAADFPNLPEFRLHLASTHMNRGILLMSMRRLEEAEQDYDAALGIHKQLAADFPTRPEVRQELSRSHINRGNLLHAMGRLKEMEQDYDVGLGIQKQLATDFPTRPEFRQELAASLTNRGNLLLLTGRLKEAKQDYDTALSIQKQLADDFPNQPDLRNELANTCISLALLHHKRGDMAAAKRRLLEGRPHHLAALKANPRHPDYRRFYRNHLAMLTIVHAGLLEKDEAIRTAETRRDVGWAPPADAFDAAGRLSQCLPIVSEHAKLNETQRKEETQFYTDAALKMLRAAVAKGYRDAAKLKSDPDFASLRERPEFQKLLAELEAMGK
jgi:serine/threonine protein kinase